MCGIAGIIAFTEKAGDRLNNISPATEGLRHRGPDNYHTFLIDNHCAFGHARLSIIDTSSSSDQPFRDLSGNYTIVYNGEIFNYKELKAGLVNEGISFKTEGDVEVLLNLFITHKEKCLDLLKGFFAFAIYNHIDKSVFIARDRFGVKPLYYSIQKDALCFASELRSVRKLCTGTKLNEAALLNYLQLNYIPGHQSILAGIKRLEPGYYITYSQSSFKLTKYYTLLPLQDKITNPLETMRELLTNSVKARLIADVPVGSFLSGGIDSTIVTGIASQFSPAIHSFSIGFKDNPYYDESHFAELAAEKFKTNHHSFLLTNDDLLNDFDAFLNSIDEPFADSSALNVFILSKRTKEIVKVALSGDGADEVFAGYNKHKAEWLITHNKVLNMLAPLFAGISSAMPQSRSSFIFNKLRQFKRYNDGRVLSPKDRYWKWATISTEAQSEKIFPVSNQIRKEAYAVKEQLLSTIDGSMNGVLRTDVNLVLPYDMLTKVDMMSMANGLEVRSPFMDHKLIEFAFSLDEKYKITKAGQKIILKEAFGHLLPNEILKRKKHGFEVPLHKWFNNELKDRIDNDWLSKDLIREQNIFNYNAVADLKKELYSGSPGDAPARVWALIIFNEWWKKNLRNA